MTIIKCSNNRKIMNKTEYANNNWTEVNSAQYLYIYMQRLSYKWISWGTQGELYMQAKGDYLNQVNFISDGSWDSQTERLSHVSRGQINSRGAIRLESTQIRCSCDGQAGRMDSHKPWPRTLKTKLNLKG
jgi:hypothetical protein